MSAKVNERHKCVVCGRVFPEGQGIVLKLGPEVLEFHSSKCFAKFSKKLLERIPYDEIKGYVKRLREEYEELVAEKQRSRVKKIV